MSRRQQSLPLLPPALAARRWFISMLALLVVQDWWGCVCTPLAMAMGEAAIV